MGFGRVFTEGKSLENECCFLLRVVGDYGANGGKGRCASLSSRRLSRLRGGLPVGQTPGAGSWSVSPGMALRAPPSCCQLGLSERRRGIADPPGQGSGCHAFLGCSSPSVRQPAPPSLRGPASHHRDGPPRGGLASRRCRQSCHVSAASVWLTAGWGRWRPSVPSWACGSPCSRPSCKRPAARTPRPAPLGRPPPTPLPEGGWRPGSPCLGPGLPVQGRAAVGSPDERPGRKQTNMLCTFLFPL